MRLHIGDALNNRDKPRQCRGHSRRRLCGRIRLELRPDRPATNGSLASGFCVLCSGWTQGDEGMASDELADGGVAVKVTPPKDGAE